MKNKPIITQTEIISRAIRSLEDEIKDLESKRDFLPKEMIDSVIEEPTKKLEALKVLYRFETGNSYN